MTNELTSDGRMVSNAPSVVAWAQHEIQSIEVTPLGVFGHCAPEDTAERIAASIAAWLHRQVDRP